MACSEGVNTHLSEILLELLEPIVLELGGGEITSTEEALHMIDELNKKITGGIQPREINTLPKSGL